MFKVIFAKKARQDLQEISSYHRKTASPQVANKIRKGIIDSAKKLQTFPHRKPILEGTEDRSSPVRYTKKWSFKILFSIFVDKKQVEILGLNMTKNYRRK